MRPGVLSSSLQLPFHPGEGRGRNETPYPKPAEKCQLPEGLAASLPKCLSLHLGAGGLCIETLRLKGMELAGHLEHNWGGSGSSSKPCVSCLPGTSLGSVPGGSITKGTPSTRVPSESPITYRGSITHVGVWGHSVRVQGGTRRRHSGRGPDCGQSSGQPTHSPRSIPAWPPPQWMGWLLGGTRLFCEHSSLLRARHLRC